MNWRTRIQEALKKPASRWNKFFRDVLVDLALVSLSLVFTYWMVDTSAGLAKLGAVVFAQGLLFGMLAVGVLLWRGLYSINIRYIGLGDFLNVVLAGVLLGGAFVVFQRLSPVVSSTNPLMEPLLFGFFNVALLAGVRVAQRIYSWRTINNDENSVRIQRKRTLVIGAGDAGEMVMREIARSRNPVQQVVGILDDDPQKNGQRIHGIKVLGDTTRIPTLVSDLGVEELLIAIPSAKGEDVRRIMNICNTTSARVRLLPPVKTMLHGKTHITSQLREIDIEDLLRRDPVQTDLQGISSYLSGERVMITGGGGSIGSELTRQICNFSPANLIILGKGENSVYEIEQELVQTNRYQPTSVIADVRDRQSMEFAFQQHQPTVVFHAAAHKHVPLMQGNPIEAIRNNVWGTWQTAELAIKYGARKFVYISTDKAVKPSSIMGATKRVGEMIVSALGRRSETEFAIVRFGNVMGSRGSLIPLLKAQIKRGGPVRVTHEDMTRYFMTIPEAVQLILQSGTMGQRGEIFLLDMGEPIRILDLATDLVRLSGLVPGEDIEIQFTGVRPGEKIHEELLYEQEELQKTAHPKISMVEHGKGVNWEWLRREVEALLDLCEQGKAEEARQCLMELAWGKTPSQEVAVIHAHVS